MKTKLVIFDCDGVLVDTETVTNRIIADNLTLHGLPISPEECHTLFTGGTMQGVFSEARARGANLPENWLDQIYGEVFDGLAQGVDVIDGVFEVLDAIEAAGITMAIASNGPPRKMEISLGPSGLHERFAGRIYSRVTHGPPKPDPAMLFYACNDANISPEHAVMIDDSPAGLVAAEKAKVRPIGFDGLGAPQRLANHSADVITDMRHLLPLIGL